MTENLDSNRFYYKSRQQYKTFLFLMLFWFATFIYALSLRDRTVGKFFEIMSLVYPIVIVVSVFQNLRRFNYLDVDSKGITITNLGIQRRRLLWAEVGSVSSVNVGGSKCVGIDLLPKFKRSGFAANYRNKNFGHDWLVRESFSNEGQSFTDWVEEHLSATESSKNDGKPSKKIVKVERGRIDYKFKFSDIWTRPNYLAWFGATLVLNILSGFFRHRYHTVSSILEIAGLITLGIAGASLARFRRESDTRRGREKAKKPNDWSNLS